MITISDMDLAAVYLVLGGRFMRVEGKYPNNKFVVKVSKWIPWYARVIGWVPYLHFSDARRFLKRKGRRAAGLPIHFTGDSRSHFTFEDLAVVKT